MIEDAPPVLATTAGPAGQLFEKALVALIDVLEVSGSVNWLDPLREDLQTWRESGSTERHRQSYGGMGSLNDSRVTDVWLDTALSQVMHVTASTALEAEREPRRFVQVTPRAEQMRLIWMRCEACRHGFVDDDHLNGPAAIAWASWVVPRRLTTDDAAAVISSVVGSDSSQTRKPYRLHLGRLATDLGLEVQDLLWDRKAPCPNCRASQWGFPSASAF